MQPGDPLRRPDKRTETIVKEASTALTSAELTAVLQIDVPAANWHKKGGNETAAALMRSITRDLKPDTTGVFDERSSMILQDMAFWGAEAINGKLQEDHKDKSTLDVLIQTVNNWKGATDVVSGR